MHREQSAEVRLAALVNTTGVTTTLGRTGSGPKVPPWLGDTAHEGAPAAADGRGRAAPYFPGWEGAKLPLALADGRRPGSGYSGPKIPLALG